MKGLGDRRSVSLRTCNTGSSAWKHQGQTAWYCLSRGCFVNDDLVWRWVGVDFFVLIACSISKAVSVQMMTQVLPWLPLELPVLRG